MLFNRASGLFGSVQASGQNHSAAEQFLDLAPLVDIVFTLILFFMLTSPFVTQLGIKVQLPAVSNVTSIRPSEVEIMIDASDAVFISERRVDLADLDIELKRLARRNQPVLITGDIKASLGVVLEVWDAAKNAGIRELNIRTQVKKRK